MTTTYDVGKPGLWQAQITEHLNDHNIWCWKAWLVAGSNMWRVKPVKLLINKYENGNKLRYYELFYYFLNIFNLTYMYPFSFIDLYCKTCCHSLICFVHYSGPQNHQGSRPTTHCGPHSTYCRTCLWWTFLQCWPPLHKRCRFCKVISVIM